MKSLIFSKGTIEGRKFLKALFKDVYLENVKELTSDRIEFLTGDSVEIVAVRDWNNMQQINVKCDKAFVAIPQNMITEEAMSVLQFIEENFTQRSVLPKNNRVEVVKESIWNRTVHSQNEGTEQEKE